MMKNAIWLCLAFLVQNQMKAQITNGEELLKKMHDRYFHAPCKMYTFSQHNKHYRNDSMIRTSEWHEAIEFPDKFRIDFGDKSKGNFVIFRNDSAINYKAGKISRARSDTNSLLLILGGMYYREFKDVLERLKSTGYKTEVLSEQKYHKKTVYVIGAKENDLVTNQIWISKKKLKAYRIIENNGNGETIEIRFEKHRKWCKGYMETKVSFRRNGKLEQVEVYYDIKKAEKFPE